MNTVLSLAGLGLLLLVLAAFWNAAKRGMSDPKKIRAAIDDHYQSRLKETAVPSNEYEVDFVFSSASEASVKSLEAALVLLSYSTSVEKASSDEWIVEGKSVMRGGAINFRTLRSGFEAICEPLDAQYIGPGGRTLKLVGIELPA